MIYVVVFDPIKMLVGWAHQNDRLNLSFVKDINTVGKQMARNGRKKVIYQYYSFLLRLYVGPRISSLRRRTSPRMEVPLIHTILCKKTKMF